MRHLFIVNPVADKLKGHVGGVVEEIKAFFQNYPQIDYDIHITRWSRDAVGYIRRCVSNAGELVRVYSVGGTGTMFEVVNAVIGLPNTQVAYYPFGSCNSFLHYFGNDKLHLFSSLRNLVFSNTISIDAYRGGSNYGICNGLVGLEAFSNRDGEELLENTRLPPDVCFLAAPVMHIIKNKGCVQKYELTLDGTRLDGKYVSMLIANQPCYGKDLFAAVDAHPNDGLLHIYLISPMSRTQLISKLPDHTHGNYRKHPDFISHHTCRLMAVSSDEDMCVSVDGETFYTSSIEYEIIPGAIDFVCPEGIDLARLPRIYNKPETIPEISKEGDA